MDEKMYFCMHWEHKNIEFDDHQYKICISDKINGNKVGSTIQFHGVVIEKEEVPTIGTLNGNITEKDAQLELNDFELKMSEIFRSNLEWIDMKPDNQVVKVWYYTKDDSFESKSKVDKREYPPLRFAVTVVNIKPISDFTAQKIKVEMESTLISWISNLLAT